MIIDKSTRKMRCLKTIGVSSDGEEISKFYHCGNRDMFTIAEQQQEEKQVTEYLLNNVENLLLNGTQLILNEVFQPVGFDTIDGDILKHLVIARLCQDFVVVADSGLMNKTNIALLDSGNCKYIIGARIKSESEEIKQWILSLDKNEGCFYELGKLPKARLIIAYSKKRAKKDKYNREKGIY